jgi:outer membrane protein OmpA-like peptidoglycan-associated protein
MLSAIGLVFPNSNGPARWITYFEVGLRTTSVTQATIAAVADAALDEPTTVVIVTGHTGAEGDPEANLALSRERANVIAKALRAAGVPVDRIVQRGAGGTMTPATESGDGEASLVKRARRAEIRLVERRLLSSSLAE